MPPTFAAARSVLQRAIERHVFPAACAEVGSAAQPLWRDALGHLTYAPGAAAAREDTVFDLASLTKVLATTPLVMRHVERGVLALDDPIARYLPRWRGADREAVTLRDLLAHCSGLPAHRPFHERLRGRDTFEPAICDTPLEYPPRTSAVYSDLGFMLLGFVLEDIAPLAAQFDTVRLQMGGIQDLQFHPPALWKRRTAPTRDHAERGPLVGEVDDDNTWALGGAAGQAGLFGTAAAVGDCARHLLQVLEGRLGAFRRETLVTFVTRRTGIPGSSRALGWDTMLSTSSCGTRMSPRAFGHTGFTGTSLWIDPERGVYVVLLTNRVHPQADERTREGIREVRRAFHDAVMEDVQR
jgi:CubicO group peptidase (beta-lactamase class C family)